MSGTPPSAVADFFAAFEAASHLMEAPVAPSCAAAEAKPANVVTATAAKRGTAANKKRKNGLGSAGVDLGDVMTDWPALPHG